MLGQDVVRAANAVGYSHAQLDVTDRAAVREAIGPDDLVINCAAWTNVDGAEQHEDEALRINADGARNVAEAAGTVLYVSSDYVFDGTKGEPYLESDPVNPLSAYGRTKLAGEHATADANPRHFIARSSWLFGAGGKNFVETMLGLGPEVRVVDDQVGSPTFTGHLAEALVELARTEDYGVHHVAASGSCSWFEFAREIFARAGSDTHAEPCTTADFPRPAPRPAYSVLGNERGDKSLPTWQEGLDAYLGVRV
ncbi:MAG: dTDP-4-dehydrorhamnose reductase [Thermoleophilaceae bacterium]|jgi:dTDP-4-dehydrorhamnose reductase|nr:dTDP-4-dehydrorhamnose reductase [Thermoleophilaceae bacterium]